jgi:tetratricopeptide (TPR) repeat protein
VAGLLSLWQNWRERRDILRDLRRQQGDARERARFIVRDNLTDALTALEIGDHRHAAELWTDSLGQYPHEARVSQLALRVLLGLRRFDEAEALMLRNRTRRPRDSHFALGLAQVAAAKGDYETAIRRLVEVRKQFPAIWLGYALGVQALCAVNRLQEAEALAERAMLLFRDEVSIFIDHARLADNRENWELALQRWEVVRTRFDHMSGYTGAAHAMIKVGRYDEADALLSNARTRFPTDPAPTAGLALCAQTRGNIPEAVERWKHLALRFPLKIHSCLDAARALELLDTTTDAENVLREAVDHFPAEPRPLIELGSLLLRREDFLGAADVWATLRQTFPDQQMGYVRGAEALLRAGRPAEADAVREEQRRRFNP